MPYKIRNAKGLYSTGGSTPSFNKTGKVWSTLGQLKNHLRQVYPAKHFMENESDYYKRNRIPEDWVIEEHGYIKDVCNAKKVFGTEI